MDKMSSVKVESFMFMATIILGEYNGVRNELFLDMPSCFSEHIDFNSSYGCYADLLKIETNNLGKIDVWFIDEDEDTFILSLAEVKEAQPSLYGAIVTHCYDLLNKELEK